LFLIVQMWNIG